MVVFYFPESYHLGGPSEQLIYGITSSSATLRNRCAPGSRLEELNVYQPLLPAKAKGFLIGQMMDHSDEALRITHNNDFNVPHKCLSKNKMFLYLYQGSQ